jgi:hypothetical protein
MGTAFMTLLVYSLLPSLILLAFGALIATTMTLAYRYNGRIEIASLHAQRVALALLLLWVAVVTSVQAQIPVLTLGQLAAFLSFFIWAGYSLVQWRIPQKLFSIFPMAAVASLILIAISAGLRPDKTPESVLGVWPAIHITLSLAGVAMLLGAGVYSAGSLVLYRQMERHVFGPLFSGLPSLDEMNRLRRFALYSGALLISISIISAEIWRVAFKEKSTAVISHLHPMSTLWAIVMLIVLIEHKRWLSQHRLSMLSLALSTVVLILIVVSVLEIFAGAIS